MMRLMKRRRRAGKERKLLNLRRNRQNLVKLLKQRSMRVQTMMRLIMRRKWERNQRRTCSVGIVGRGNHLMVGKDLTRRKQKVVGNTLEEEIRVGGGRRRGRRSLVGEGRTEGTRRRGRGKCSTVMVLALTIRRGILGRES